MSVKIVKTVQTIVWAEVSKAELLRALNKTLFPHAPAMVDVFVQVPGGGDWSNTDLHIGDDVPLIVTYTVKEVDNVKPDCPTCHNTGILLGGDSYPTVPCSNSSCQWRN